MPSLTYFAFKSTPASTKNALEPPRMLALMVITQLFPHLYDAALSFLTR